MWSSPWTITVLFTLAVQDHHKTDCFPHFVSSSTSKQKQSHGSPRWYHLNYRCYCVSINQTEMLLLYWYSATFSPPCINIWLMIWAQYPSISSYTNDKTLMPSFALHQHNIYHWCSYSSEGCCPWHPLSAWVVSDYRINGQWMMMYNTMILIIVITMMWMMDYCTDLVIII